MPFRIVGYDGAAYRSQLQQERKKMLPVMTIVLYFGTDRHWNSRKKIKELMEIPRCLDTYVNDYQMHVFEVAWLTEEQISHFRSDFKVVANFFVQKRKNKDYLVGHYYERDKNAPLIIFFHGLWSNGYVSGEPTYKITKNQGWNLLLVSIRAHDESEGEFSTLGVIEQYDCKAWANWAVERFGEEKSVFFMGVSTGASIAMMSSNLGLPKSVRGIIDDCGFTSTMEMIDVNCKSHLPDYIPTRMFDFFVEMGTSVWGHFCISKADACKAVSQTDIPILIIHGDRDTQAPLSMAYRLYDSCSSEKQLYVVHGANHAENYRKDPEGYENVIAQFVEEHSGALKKEY